MRPMKKLFIIFILAFFLNLIWENLHSYLYIHYQSGLITEWLLVRASLVDAVFITIMGWFFITIAFFRKRVWLAFLIGVAAAVLLEFYALKTGRWDYNEFMPIIPLLNVGLTPTIQLGFIAYLIYKLFLIRKISKN